MQRDFVDTFTLGFGCLLALVVGLSAGDLATGCGMLVFNAALGWVALRFLPRLRVRRGLARFLGLTLPLLTFYVFYRETQIGLAAADVVWLDHHVARVEWDWWMRGTGSTLGPLVGEISAFAYMAYVPLMLLVAAAVQSQATGRATAPAASLVRRICLAWAVCYLLFLVLPVLGPRFMFPELQPPRLGNGPFSMLARLNQDHGMVRGAAFPSAHVAAVLVTVWSAWRWWRRGFPVVLLMAIALALGAVYLGYHYTVDVAAGCAVGTAAVGIDLLSVRWWEGRRESGVLPTGPVERSA